MVEMKLTIISAGPKPPRLLSSGETKTTHEVKAVGHFQNASGKYKATLIITGPDEELAINLLDTLELGDELGLKCTPPK